MTLALDELPNEVAALKQLILIEREQRQAAIDAAVQARIDAAVQAAVAAILRRYYGPRSEKFDPRQLLLFGQIVDQLPLDEASITEESGEPLATRRVKNRDKHGRQQLPKELERIEIEHDLDDKRCPACGEVRCRIGAEVSEQLEYFPASFKVLKHIRHKYACTRCDADGYTPNVATASKPPQPIERGLPGPSLLAYVVTSKLGDHLPLYRLESIFARQRVHVARSTMCAWMAAAGELARPLVELMTARVKQSRVIHTDDTPVPIQSPGAKQCRKGRIWCYLGDAANPYTVYDYTPSRGRDGPAGWLAGFSGYLQADAYGGYDGIYAGGEVTEVACWAHARRKFYDAQDSDGRRAAEMLALVGELYAIERQAKEACCERGANCAASCARIVAAQRSAVPVLDQIKSWLDTEGEVVLPRSPLGHGDHLCQEPVGGADARTSRKASWRSTTTPASEPLKRVAIGRKNWLFAGHDAAALNHARLWSLIAQAERHGIDPQRYLTSVLAKIGQTSSVRPGPIPARRLAACRRRRARPRLTLCSAERTQIFRRKIGCRSTYTKRVYDHRGQLLTT